MTKKFDDFMEALGNLCREHEVLLSVTGYDGLQVWDAKCIIDGGLYIHASGVEDKTQEKAK